MTVTATAVQAELQVWRECVNHARQLVKEVTHAIYIEEKAGSLERWTDLLSEMERKELSAGKHSRLAEEAALKLLGHKTADRTLDTSPAAVALAKRSFDFGI